MKRTKKVFSAAIALSLALGGFQRAEAAPPFIVEVRTAAADVLVVVVQTGPHTAAGAVPGAVDTTPAGWTVADGGAPVPVTALHLYSVPSEEDPLDAQWRYPVHIHHRVYLRLSQPLQQGHSYQIGTPYGPTSLLFDDGATFCESIKVNQVGYSRRSTLRFANLGVYMGDGGSMTFSSPPTYRVVSEGSGQVVASGAAVYMGDDTAVGSGAVVTSGEHVYRLSLNNVPEGGPYFVVVDGFGRSRSFGVGEAYTGLVSYVATRGLYHQRCGMALTQPYTAHTHAACHLQIARDLRVPASVPQDNLVVPGGSPLSPVSGGYHDAGDMDHPPSHWPISILMLSAFEAFPTHFADGQYNIPESGNGVPDFLDEVLWGVRHFESMQIMDPADGGRTPNQYGGVMAGWSTNGYTDYGDENAANDRNAYGTWQVTVDATAWSAGIFAQASRLVRPYDAARADALLNRAQLAWAYLSGAANVNAANTWFMYAALQLYLATGDAQYDGIFRTAADAIVVRQTTSWPENYLPGNQQARCRTAHFVSYLLPHGRAVDAALSQALQNRILNFANNGTYMGPGPWNAAYPQGVTKFLGWGSGTAQGMYADVFLYGTLFTTDPVRRQNYINAVSLYADYSLGLNPMGMSYYTGLGTDQPASPLDANSYYTKYGLSDGVTPDNHRDAQGNPIGNVPGILVYGPTEGRSGAAYQRVVSDKLYPAWDQLPQQRRYAHGWSLVNSNEFTHGETTVWNVVMLGFLYDAGGTTPPPGPADTLSPSRPQGLRRR